MWSLREWPGHLRLRAFAPLRQGDFLSVGNVLSQRAMRTEQNRVTVRLDLRGVAEGQEAGLAHYSRTYCTVGVACARGGTKLVMNLNGVRSDGPDIVGRLVWLRSTWDFDGVSQFAYSLDGKVFHEVGLPYRLAWGAYRGDRVGLFTFNDSGVKGYVDMDGFDYQCDK
jgi:beta-xylosidase